jgi:hypothetical protein
VLGLPEQDLDDGETSFLGMFVNESGDILRGGIRVHLEYTFATFPQERQQRVVATEQHIVIEHFIDPALDFMLDLTKIYQHATRVEHRSLQSNHRPAIVPVEVPTLAGIIQQAMTITKIDFACYPKHDDVNQPLTLGR